MLQGLKEESEDDYEDDVATKSMFETLSLTKESKWRTNNTNINEKTVGELEEML